MNRHFDGKMFIVENNVNLGDSSWIAPQQIEP